MLLWCGHRVTRWEGVSDILRKIIRGTHVLAGQYSTLRNCFHGVKALGSQDSFLQVMNGTPAPSWRLAYFLPPRAVAQRYVSSVAGGGVRRCRAGVCLWQPQERPPSWSTCTRVPSLSSALHASAILTLLGQASFSDSGGGHLRGKLVKTRQEATPSGLT